MTISITLQGDDWNAIERQARDMLGLVRGPAPVNETAPANRIPDDIAKAAGLDADKDPFPPTEWNVANPTETPPEPEPEPVKAEPTKPVKVAAKSPLFKKAPPSPAKAPPVAKEPDPAPEAPSLTPAALIDLRAKTLSELQAAYANGKQQIVFKLLADYGNGAKSFRELQLEDFPPLRQAIDAGALA